MRSPQRLTRQLLVGAGIFSAYLLAAHLGLRVATINENASPVWPASGIAMAALLLFGWRYGPVVALAALVANLETSIPWYGSVLIACGNASEALIASAIVVRGRTWLERLIGLHTETGALLLACLLAPLSSALVGTLVLGGIGALSAGAAGTSFLTWWVGDVIGALVVLPPALIFANKERRVAPKRRYAFVEAVCLPLSLVTSLALLFAVPVSVPVLGAFALFPLLLWSSVRFGDLASALVVVGVAVGAIMGTSAGNGPFVSASLNQSLINMQIFLGAYAASALALRGFAGAGPMQRPALLLLAGWTVCAVITHLVDRAERERDDEAFLYQIKQTVGEIEQRLHNYTDALQGVSGLIAVIGKPEPSAWRSYVESLRLDDRDPGLRGLGVIQIVQGEQLPNVMSRTRVPGGGESGELHYVITQIEPSVSNEAALGLDIASEPELRAAAHLSRDTGLPAMTGRVKLDQDDQGGTAVLLLHPLYRANAELSEVSARRKNLVGWTFAPFHTNEFFREPVRTLADRLTFDVYDGETVSEDGLVFSSSSGSVARRPQRYERTTRLVLAQRALTIGWRRGAAFPSSRSTMAAAFAACSSLFVLMLAGYVVSLQTLQLRAERLAAERMRALADREVSWQTLMEIAPVGIFQTDLLGNCTFVNPRWCEMAGLRMDQALGSGWLSSVHPSDQEPVMEQWGDVLAHSVASRAQFRFVHDTPHGQKIVWVIAEATRVHDASGKPTGYIGTVLDISHIKEQQLDLVQISKMTALGEMAGGIAHEINNPLWIIAGRTSQARRWLAARNPDPEIDAVLSQVEETVQRVATIVRGLRAFARDAEMDPCVESDVSTVVANTLALCQERFKMHGINVAVSCPPEFVVECRPVQISQVLLNLLANSFDAVVSLENPWIEVQAHDRTSDVEILVKDSGPRISDDVAARVMEPFFTTKPFGKGTGLGLSISKGLVERHGGTLMLDRCARHTCFVVRLPKRQAPPVHA